MEADQHRGKSRAILDAVSRKMVRLYREQYGRGPREARTDWAGPDTLVTHLEDTLTQPERNLVRIGESQTVQAMRLTFQHASAPEFCATVERLTGRKVKEFYSAVDCQAGGAAIEVFVLHPEGSDAPSRAA